MSSKGEWLVLAFLIGSLLALLVSVVFHLTGSTDVAIWILVGGLLSVAAGIVVNQLLEY